MFIVWLTFYSVNHVVDFTADIRYGGVTIGVSISIASGVIAPASMCKFKE